MSQVRLSICMPTYNFGAFIGDTLASIIPQLQPGVEIVILDGGSTDDTGKVVESYARRFPQIVYERQPFRGGIDRDMARSVDIAHGDYCWLFSSDDLMKPGALSRILMETHSGLDLYLCGLTLCDKNMVPVADHPVSRADWGEVFDLGDAAERRRYFALADTTTAFFSFMGSLVFRRNRWQAQPMDEKYVGSCWAHVVRIMCMIPGGLTVKYLGEPLQLKRGDNDSFMEKGVIHRNAIAIDGFHRIAADVFGERSIEARHIRRVVANEFSPGIMFFTRVHCRDQGRQAEIPELNRLVYKTYGDFTLRNLFYRAAYHPVFDMIYEFMRRSYKAMRRLFCAPGRR